MNYLVTGATGLVGRRLVKKLVEDGNRVRALVRGDSQPVTALGAESVRGDMTDAASLHAASVGMDCVIHSAALVGDWGDESLYQSVNVRGTGNLLKAAKQAGASRFIYLSSLIVYGDDLRGRQPCREDNPTTATVSSAYARSKRAAEELCRESLSDEFQPTIVRPGNIYGPRSAVWVDEVVRVLRTGVLPLVEGGRGLATLAHVDNVVELLVLAARNPHAAGRIYNANDGNDVTWWQYLGDMAEMIGMPRPSIGIPGAIASAIGALMEATAHLWGKKTRPMLTREAVRVLRCHAPVPIDRAKQELGYEPIVGYEQGLAQVREYLESPGKGSAIHG